MNRFLVVLITIFDVCLLTRSGAANVQGVPALNPTSWGGLLAHNSLLRTENSRLQAFLAVSENSKLEYERSENGVESIPFCNDDGMCKDKSSSERLVNCEDTEYIRYCLEGCRNGFIRCNKVSLVAFESSRTSRYERRVREDTVGMSECEQAEMSGVQPLPAKCGTPKKRKKTHKLRTKRTKRTHGKKRHKKKHKKKHKKPKEPPLVKAKPQKRFFKRPVKKTKMEGGDEDEDEDEDEGEGEAKPTLSAGQKGDVNTDVGGGKAKSFSAEKPAEADSGLQASSLENDAKANVNHQGMATEKALSKA